MKKGVIFLAGLIFLMSSHFVLATDYLHDKEITLYQNKTKTIIAKRIDFNDPQLNDSGNIKSKYFLDIGWLGGCYDLFINNKKVVLKDSYGGNGVAGALCFSADNIKFYITDKADWYVFASKKLITGPTSSHYDSNGDLVDYPGPSIFSNEWLFINLPIDGSAGKDIYLQEYYFDYSSSVKSCKNTNSITIQYNDLIVKNLKLPIYGGILTDSYDKADCAKFQQIKDSSDKSVKIIKQPKFLGFNATYIKKSQDESGSVNISYNSSAKPDYSYLEKPSKQLMCSSKDSMYYASYTCGTQKKIMGLSPDMTKVYFTNDADYQSGNKTKNWKNNYTWDFKKNKIIKEKIGKTIKIIFAKDLK